MKEPMAMGAGAPGSGAGRPLSWGVGRWPTSPEYLYFVFYFTTIQEAQRSMGRLGGFAVRGAWAAPEKTPPAPPHERPPNGPPEY